DPVPQARPVVAAATVHAADDQAVQVRDPLPGLRDRLDHDVLTLPLLHVADDARDRRVVRDAELAADRVAAAGRELRGVDTVEDREEAARAQTVATAVLADL